MQELNEERARRFAAMQQASHLASPSPSMDLETEAFRTLRAELMATQEELREEKVRRFAEMRQTLRTPTPPRSTQMEVEVDGGRKARSPSPKEKCKRGPEQGPKKRRRRRGRRRRDRR